MEENNSGPEKTTDHTFEKGKQQITKLMMVTNSQFKSAI